MLQTRPALSRERRAGQAQSPRGGENITAHGAPYIPGERLAVEDLKQRMNVLEDRVSEHATDLAKLDTRLERYAETRYVDGALKPLENTVTEIKEALRHIVKGQETLARGQETLNGTYNQLLKERGERENKEHEKKIEILEAQLKTANERGVIKSIKENLTPLLAFIVTLVTALGILLALIKAYVLNAPAK